MSKSKTTNQNTNKDLSCLRCRKKKAKCSKTRPTCTRCERSNHPCEYPDAPPNLTDLSKKVLDLYDSLKDLEGEFLFKYMQQSTVDNEENGDEDMEPTINDNNNNNNREPSISPLPLSSPAHLTDSKTTELLNNTDNADNNNNNDNDNNSNNNMTTNSKEVAWSMSYLPDGISIHATTHNILDYMQFIDKFTRQCIHDFGIDSLSTYWNLDYHQDLIMELFNHDNENHFIEDDKVIKLEETDDNDEQQEKKKKDDNHHEEEDEDDFNEDYYLVTIPIFTTTHFLHDQHQQQKEQPITTTLNKNFVSSHSTLDFQQLYHTLPSYLQYVHLKLEQYTKTTETPGVPYQIMLILKELKPYLMIQKNNTTNNNSNNIFIDTLSMIYILSTYLICKKMCTIKKNHDIEDDDDDDPLPSTWTDTDLYYHLKLMMVDIVLQISPTYAACLSVLLLIWYNALQDNKEMDHHLLDLAWHMFKNLTYYPFTTMENQIISASLIYLDVYATTFRYYHTSISPSSHFIQEIGHQLKSRMKTLCHDIHTIKTSTSSSTNNNHQHRHDIYYKQQFVFIILEAQLMLFLQQILELFYLKDNDDGGDYHSNNKDKVDDDLIVRKVDVDDVLTLVRDLEQWEQQLPDWATPTTITISASTGTTTRCEKKNNEEKEKEQQEKEKKENGVTNMTLQLHLTLHFIKILLFRPFCTEFKDYGIEQTHTKTTFLDLSLHSADKISDYFILLEQGKENDHYYYYYYHRYYPLKHWFFALHQMVLDVIKRVRHTFNSDQDILLQLDTIVNKIEPI